ncbi:methyl-accepting chemotaxis protein [Tepidicaulis sp. LMO-SS28]|uniref:methyl-accepting chemotaxis protein n=1 Tax=Tepidicaulis sp. LMO-SS28 TaxID=3447455 RepID=UPI003EDF297B
MFKRFSWGGAAEMEAKLAALDKSLASIEFGMDGTILTANGNFLKVMGYSLEEIRGKHHSLFVPAEEHGSEEYKAFWRSLNEGEFQARQFRRIGKGGREVWIEATYNPILGRDGKPAKIVKYATDITESKRELTGLRGQTDAINKSQAVIEFDLDGSILTANENFLAAMGYDLSEIQGKHHSMFVTPEERGSAEYQAFWNLLREGKYQAAQYKRLGKGGREVWIEASYNPIMDPRGRPYKIVKYATDVSAQVKLLIDLKALIETNFAEMNDAVAQASTEAEQANESADQTSANVQTVAASVEELAASIAEIAQSMTRSKTAGEQAHGQVVTAQGATERLSSAANSMTGIVELIQEIAGQINLLALNATIEAARAGEAGKGFAVVASEVKTLANQAAKATEHISKEIGDVQSVSSEVVTSLQVIREAIGNVRDYVSSTAAAVEEQSAATGSISQGMQDAAQAVDRFTASIGGISVSVSQVAGAVSRTRQAAEVLAR